MSPVVDHDAHRVALIHCGLWIPLGLAFLSVGGKLWVKVKSLRAVQVDDVLMVLAFLLALGQNLALYEATLFGLGFKQTGHIDHNDGFLKAILASETLYTPAAFFPKLASLYFFLSLTNYDRQKLHKYRKAILISMIFLISWTFSSIFIITFQCASDEPWRLFDGDCVEKTTFWAFNGTIDILSQLEIALLPLLLYSAKLCGSHNRFAKLAFTPNILTLPLIITRLAFFSSLASLFHNDKIPYASFTFYMISGLHCSISLIVACLPFFSKLVIDSLKIRPYPISERTQV